jgi:uncharacterized membrane protein
MRLWLLTMSYLLASVVAGSVFPRVEYRYLHEFVHGISVASAQALLSSTASGMMALTAIVFSLSFVIVQYSGSAYSPRLVSWFARDPLIFHALGVFISTFVYALATLAWIDRDGNGYVPFYSTTLVLALIIVSMILLVQLVLRIGELQISHVLRFVGGAGRAVIERTFPLLERDSPPLIITVPETPHQTVRYSGAPKAVANIDVAELVKIASASDALIALACSIGDTVTGDMALFRIYGAKTAIDANTLIAALRLRNERKVDSDAKYAIRILVDIAIRALSPAVNDPTTAVQSLDQIEDLLYRLGKRRLEAEPSRDATGTVRVVVPTSTWEDYLSLGFDEIRICGASQVQVMRRLRSALKALAASASGARSDAVQRYLQHLDATVESSALDTADRVTAHMEDRQGLGVSR